MMALLMKHRDVLDIDSNPDRPTCAQTFKPMLIKLKSDGKCLERHMHYARVQEEDLDA